MGKSTLSFFSLARCRLQLQAEKLAWGGEGGRDSTPADRSPRRTSKPLWVPRRPNLRPSRLAPRFPVRPSLVPSFSPQWYRYIWSHPKPDRAAFGDSCPDRAALDVTRRSLRHATCGIGAGCGSDCLSQHGLCHETRSLCLHLSVQSVQTLVLCVVRGVGCDNSRRGAASSRGRRVVCLRVQRKSRRNRGVLYPSAQDLVPFFHSPTPGG